MSANDTATIFTDKSKITLIGASANAAQYPYIDFRFEEGDPCTEATLTFDVESEGWHGVICIAEDADSDFDDGVNATDEQVAALKAKLPENAQELIDQFKADNQAPKL